MKAGVRRRRRFVRRRLCSRCRRRGQPVLHLARREPTADELGDTIRPAGQHAELGNFLSVVDADHRYAAGVVVEFDIDTSVTLSGDVTWTRRSLSLPHLDHEGGNAWIIDLDRWRRLRRAEANAADDGPSFIQLQEANDRRARARDQLARFKADGPRGYASSPPIHRAAHAGEQILRRRRRHEPGRRQKAFERSVRELEHGWPRPSRSQSPRRAPGAVQRRAAMRCTVSSRRSGVGPPSSRRRSRCPATMAASCRRPAYPGRGACTSRPAARDARLPREASMNSAIEKLDAEIARLQAEVRTVEAAPPTVAERFAAAADELRSAEQLYRTYGLKVSAAHPGETAHLQRQALIGA